LTALGGQINKQTVAIAIVCFLYATSAFAEVCDKAGWDPSDGVVTVANEVVNGARWSFILALVVTIGIMKGWRWLVWPITLLSLGLVILGLSDDPEDPITLSMIAEGCRTGWSGTIMSISFAMPLATGALVAVLKFKMKSGKP
jgi:hypothetical protein